MEYIAVFKEPYCIVNVSGKTKKDCLKKALAGFDSDCHSGSNSLEEYLKTEIEHYESGPRYKRETMSLKYFYSWDNNVCFIRAVNGKLVVEDISEEIISLLNDLESKYEVLIKKVDSSERRKQYESLKKKFEEEE